MNFASGNRTVRNSAPRVTSRSSAPLPSFTPPSLAGPHARRRPRRLLPFQSFRGSPPASFPPPPPSALTLHSARPQSASFGLRPCVSGPYTASLHSLNGRSAVPLSTSHTDAVSRCDILRSGIARLYIRPRRLVRPLLPRLWSIAVMPRLRTSASTAQSAMAIDRSGLRCDRLPRAT